MQPNCRDRACIGCQNSFIAKTVVDDMDVSIAFGHIACSFKVPISIISHHSKENNWKIKSSKPDIIWIYGEEIAGIAKDFEEFKRIVTMPDCESMFYYRMLRLRWTTKHLSQILRYAFAYWQYKSMERHNCRADVIYYFVGEADAEFFKILTQLQTRYFYDILFMHIMNRKDCILWVEN